MIRAARQMVIPDIMQIRVIAPASAASNGLLNALIAYWPGNEANENMLDLHTNGLTLTKVNTPTSTVGLVYALARKYSYAGHYRSDDAFTSTGDVDCTLAIWIQRTSFVGPAHLIGKWNATAGSPDHEYRIALENMANSTFTVSPDGTAATSISSGGFTDSAWHLLAAWHDSVANTINIQVDNGTVYSASHTTGIYDGAARFALGNDGYGHNWAQIYIGPVMFWKSAAGAGGVLTAEQRTALYNAGAGLPYASFTI